MFRGKARELERGKLPPAPTHPPPPLPDETLTVTHDYELMHEHNIHVHMHHGNGVRIKCYNCKYRGYNVHMEIKVNDTQHDITNVTELFYMSSDITACYVKLYCA